MKIKFLGVLVAAFMIATCSMGISAVAAENSNGNSSYGVKATYSNSSPVSLSSDGWKKSGDDWYYVKNGKLLKEDWLTEKGKKYYFGSDGKMYSDKIAYLHDTMWNVHTYYFNKDGSMHTGWYTTSYKMKYHFAENGRADEGIKSIDGNTYYFISGGTMVSSSDWSVDGKRYFLDDEGKMYACVDLSTDGWKYSGGNWYYVKDGDTVISYWLQLGKDKYRFDIHCRMYKNCEEFTSDITGSHYGYFRFSDDGKMYKGWYKDKDGDYIYYDELGKVNGDFRDINGAKYYFDYHCKMQTNTVIHKDNKAYVIGGDGKVYQIIDESRDGWQKHGNYYFYVKNQHLVKTIH